MAEKFNGGTGEQGCFVLFWEPGAVSVKQPRDGWAGGYLQACISPPSAQGRQAGDIRNNSA